MQQGFMAESPLGYAQLTSIDASTLVSSATFGSAIAAGIPAGTQILLITPQTQAIRWRDDGTAPTATVGYPLAVGQELRYTAHAQNALRVISQVAGAAINIVAYAGS
jgi:hypothetical protein